MSPHLSLRRWVRFATASTVLSVGIALLSIQAADMSLVPSPPPNEEGYESSQAFRTGEENPLVVDRLNTWAETKSKKDISPITGGGKNQNPSKTSNRTSGEWEAQAREEASRGRVLESLAAYRRAIAMSPRQSSLRIAYAEQLRRSGDLLTARRELETVLIQEPANRSARDLLDVIEREIRVKEQR